MRVITSTAATLSTVNYSQGIEQQQQYLTFMLSGKTNAISILRIAEIIQCGQLTELPWMPNFIRGVINLRGILVPVIDLGARYYGKSPAPIGRCNGIIIVEVAMDEEMHSVGVMVGAVNAVLEIPDSKIKPLHSIDSNIQADCIAGMSKINGKVVIILNIQQVVSMEDMAELAAVGTASAAELSQVRSYKVSLCGNA
ncbi:MAG: chemotaxis protein CheW [Gammaproteobacteria bacterium]